MTHRIPDRPSALLAGIVTLAFLVAAVPARANDIEVTDDAGECDGPIGTGVCNGFSCGMETLLSDQGNAYVQSDHPDQESRFVVSFCFSANGVTLPPQTGGTPGSFRIMKFYRESGNDPRQHMFLTLKRNQTNTQYRLSLLQRNASGTFEQVGEFFYGDGSHLVEIVWDKDGGTGGTGRVEIYRDGVLRASRDMDLTGWNVDRVRMGAIDEIASGVSGSVYFDNYVSTR